MKKKLNKKIYKQIFQAHMLKNYLNMQEVKQAVKCDREMLRAFVYGDIKDKEQENNMTKHLKTCLFCMEEYREEKEMLKYQLDNYRKE